ncbi:substrate-binding periplasmic protein [Litoribrevibacter albus]|uniref:Transporter substrate-binding domain-containing protein n=1 Tax=Litoribrevibacter albus TaxID=1473156 RepID=A0AA37S9E6_9GAMM|nr:transporter substrate-binding domain-containing protein [Litoribrevibacter albus]GLQ30863.1 hypothetical protein GCM10007876_13420 [Litoribrevibacter albus]
MPQLINRLLLSITCLCFFALPADADVIEFAVGEWAPYISNKDPNSPLEKIVSEAYALEGIEVKYSYFPWKRSYGYAKKGRFLGTFPWTHLRSRAEDFNINPTPILKDPSVYFHLKHTDFEWATLTSLKQYKVGVTVGYKNQEIYERLGIPAEVVPYEELNFKMLLQGRIDVYGASKRVGYAMIKSMFPPDEVKQFTNHPEPYTTDIYHILFSKQAKDSEKYMNAFEAGFSKLKNSGRYEEILKSSDIN